MAGVITLLDQPRTLNAQGKPTSAVIFFYTTGTTVLAPIYEDAALTIPSDNPILLASGEVFPDTYLDPAITYRRRIVYGDGTIHDVDPLPGVSVAAGDINDELVGPANTREYSLHEYLDKDVLKPLQFTGNGQQSLVNAITEGSRTLVGNVQGQTVFVPRGILTTTTPFNIDTKVAIEGVGKRGTIIQADPAFVGTYMATVDNGTLSMFDNYLSKLTFDANNVAGLGCIDSQAWQEGGGMRDVLLNKFRGYGVLLRNMEGGAALTRISDCEIFGSPSGCTAGIRLEDSSLSSPFQLYIETTTLSGGGALASSMPRAIDVLKGSLHIVASHVENCTTGIYLDGNGHHIISGFTGASTAGGVTNLVEIAATFTGSVTMIGCQRNGATNLLKDNRVGGFGTITYDIPYIRIEPETPLYRGVVWAAGSIDGTSGSPVVTKGFGISGIVKNGTGDYTVSFNRSAQTTSDFSVVGSCNLTAGRVQCDLNGVGSVRIRVYNSAGSAADTNELKLIVVRVA